MPARSVVAPAAILSAFLACTGGGAGGTDPDTSGGDDGPPCVEDYPEIPSDGNPDFTGTVSGEGFSSAYTRLVSANIAKTASSTSCCQDYVLAGADEYVRIAFGAAGNGLTFLADRSDELVGIGSHTATVRDLAVAKLNGDSRNDILVLRNDGKLVVALANANPLANGPYFSGYSTYTTNVGGITATNDMDVGDVDADGDLDVVLTASNNSIIYLKNNASGVFGSANWKAAGLAPQRLALGEVDGDTDSDLVVTGADGEFAYLSANGSSSVFANATIYAMFSGLVDTPGMPIVLGTMCPGHPNDAAVAVGYYDIIRVACGDGTGDFADVEEPHGDTLLNNPTDYLWEINGGQSQNEIVDLALWPSHRELFALLRHGYGDTVYLLVPGACGLSLGVPLPIAEWGAGGQFSSLAVHREAKGDTTWSAISSAGVFGLLSVR